MAAIQFLAPLAKIPQTARIIAAMLVGLLIGAVAQQVYVGVDELATAFVMLLQMTALPYISLSLITGIGGLSPARARTLFITSMAVLSVMMAVVLGFVLLAPIAFPDWENAEVYSANMLKVTAELDFVRLFIPANPFNAFANAIIPSVVMFSVFVGIGLINVKAKEQTLHVLDSLQSAIANVNVLVMRFAPLGVFCIGLKAAATVEPNQLDGLLVYIVTAAVVVLLLSFIVLPALVGIVTPLRYRHIVGAGRDAMITAFATGSFFIVIPQLVINAKALIATLQQSATGSGADTEEEGEAHPRSVDALAVPSIILPISFSLPVGGKLLALLFTLFAAWFSGAHITFNDYIYLLLAGIPQLFGSSTLAMPNLLEIFNVSAAMFDIFVVAESLIGGRIAAVLSVMFALCLPLLIAASMLGCLTFRWRVFARNLVLMPILTVLALIALRFIFSEISHQYQGYDKFIDRDFLFAGVKTHSIDKAPASSAQLQPYEDVLKRIYRRDLLRVGYFRDDLPYSFHNKDGKLVGFDIEIMNQLALDLGVRVEFVKIYRNQAAKLLNNGYLDITTGVPVIPDNMKEFTLTVPYSEQAIALVVKDERRAEFSHWNKIFTQPDLIVGIPETFFYEDAVHRLFTGSKAWEITTPRLFFREKYQHIDGMLLGAATASAWTLLHPDYTVVVPKPRRRPLSMAFPINRNDHAFELFMRNWLKMKKKSKLIEHLFDYWIAGQSPSYRRYNARTSEQEPDPF